MADTVTYGRDQNGSLVKVPLSSPVGAVFFFAKSTPPEHALACDGAAVSRAAYPELFGAIGTTFGAGDGSTTFNLPDLRGRFIRGTGGNAAALGVKQSDAIRNITGSIKKNYGDLPLMAAVSSELTILGALYIDSWRSIGAAQGSTNIYNMISSIDLDVSKIVPTAAENRPVNVALLPCIIFE